MKISIAILAYTEAREKGVTSHMHYHIQMVYEQEDIGALVKTLEFRRRPEKNLRLALKIGYPIFGMLLIATAIGVIVSIVTAGLISPLTILISLGSLIGGVVLLRRADTKGIIRRSWKKYPNKGLVLHYSFYSDYFEEKDDISGENQYKYSSITSANEDDDHFFLFTAANAAHMLKKDSFLVGSPDTFPAFLRKRSAVIMDPVE